MRAHEGSVSQNGLSGCSCFTLLCFVAASALALASGLADLGAPAHATSGFEGRDHEATSLFLSDAVDVGPVMRVAPTVLLLRGDRGEVFPDAITVIELGAETTIHDVTLLASDLKSAAQTTVPGSQISFEPNGFDLPPGASQSVTLQINGSLPHGRFSGEIVIQSSNGDTERLVFELDTAHRIFFPAGLRNYSGGDPPVNQPPNEPADPYPLNGAANRSVNVNLGWTGADPEGNDLVYDVSVGTDANALDDLVCSGVTSTFCDPEPLDAGTHYYWQVVAKDNRGLTAEGPVWDFAITGSPDVPSGPSPSDGATGQGVYSLLGWAASSDPDGDSVTYDVYFGDSQLPNTLACSELSEVICDPGTLAFATDYFWQVVARDSLGATAAGPVWRFVTGLNSPPQTPFEPSPAVAATKQTVNSDLTWRGGDPDGDAVTYDVYFGPGAADSLVCDDATTEGCDLGTLSYGTHYYWQVIATDVHSSTVAGPVWDFYTPYPPNVPSNPLPADGATNQPLNVELAWTGGDPDGDPVTYDVYLDTENPPALRVAENHSATLFTPATLAPGTTYYWRVVATDSDSLSAIGDVWRFTVGSDPPPLGCWYSFADMPTARRAPAAVELGDQIYVLGGQNEGDNWRFDVVERYDPGFDTWATMAPMPTARAWLVAAAVNGKIYAIGGSNFAKLNTVEEYDPVANAWATKAAMPTPRDDAAAAVVNGKIYVVGGWLNGMALNTVEMYDPGANVWSVKASMPISLAMTSAVAVGGKIHVMGGFDGFSVSPAHVVYDPQGDAWSFQTNLPFPRNRLAAVELGGQIYVFGGENGSNYVLDAVQRYNPSTWLWTDMNPMLTSRADLAAAPAIGRAFVFGGRSGNKYSPVLNLNEGVDFSCGGGP